MLVILDDDVQLYRISGMCDTARRNKPAPNRALRVDEKWEMDFEPPGNGEMRFEAPGNGEMRFEDLGNRETSLMGLIGNSHVYTTISHFISRFYQYLCTIRI